MRPGARPWALLALFGAGAALIAPRPRARLAWRLASSGGGADAAAANEAKEDVNYLMTQLNAAINRQDYAVAGECKAKLDAALGGRRTGNWEERGAPEWLQSRLAAFGMVLPTPVQGHALAAVATADADVVIAAPTGSGKTLAFAVPLLTALEATMLARQQRQEVDLGGLAAVAPRVIMTTMSPALWRGVMDRPPRPPTRRGSPLALVLAPSALLANQLASVLFSLVGGNLRARGTYAPGDARSIFNYKGPRGARVAVLATADELRRAVFCAQARRAERGGAPYPTYSEADEDDPGIVGGYDDLEDCDILVADVETLRAALNEDDDVLDGSQLEFICVDEADALDQDDLVKRFVADNLAAAGAPRRRMVLVGASLALDAARAGGKVARLLGLVDARRKAAPLLVDESGAQALETWMRPGAGAAAAAAARRIAIPAGLEHRVVVRDAAEAPASPVEWWVDGVARCLMRDLRGWEDRCAAAAPGSAKLPRPRAVVFCETEPQAQVAHRVLRDLLWQAHAVAALLPTLGASPLEAARSFGSDAGAAEFVEAANKNAATVLVTSPAAALGLDFPNVTHVYRIGARPEDREAALYAHEAGRCGRVGQQDRGVVTTLVTPTQEAPLRALLASQFAPDIDLVESRLPTAAEAEPLRALDLPSLFNDDGSPRYFKVVSAPQTPRAAAPADDDDDDEPAVAASSPEEAERALLENLIRLNSPPTDES
ncbi:P-loop containing nucleoside triphosphate hydrolase protein [Pelagophyceae sp. CCMP2097]|nr:P-loop containing nucleoside triphosphate hydrolase protein [Pelagophyceae sp. CCMP2097]